MKKMITVDVDSLKSELEKSRPISPFYYQIETITELISKPLNEILANKSMECLYEMIEFFWNLEDNSSDEHDLEQTRKKLHNILIDSKSVSRSFVGVF